LRKVNLFGKRRGGIGQTLRSTREINFSSGFKSRRRFKRKKIIKGIMKKVYALMTGETVIEKSCNRTELVNKRDLLPKCYNAYVCTYIGRIEINKPQAGFKQTGTFNLTRSN